MSKKEKDLREEPQTENNENALSDEATGEVLETDPEPISSAEMLRAEEETLSAEPEIPQALGQAEMATEETGEESDEIEDPIFRELAEPKLPELPKENRARLLMQSPTRIQFYWSVKHNPFQTLQKAIGNTGSYTLVVKLVNQTNGREEIFPVEAEGSWWFNVESNSVYRAEIGFYAPNRPFVRVMFSNALETPRRNPSPRQATDADWAVTAMEFANVLDATGYSQDAFEVAMAGDDRDRAEDATRNAFSQFIGDPKGSDDLEGIPMEEIRFALLAIASGFSLEDLRGHISAALLTLLEKNADKLTPENALAALNEHFDVSMEEVEEGEEVIGEAVYGLSLVHFPRSSRKRRTSPRTLLPKGIAPELERKISPVSSLRPV
ncbi:MAG: DUF4912 domain-containing protein [Pyrinomonadaceae bacterium]